MTNINVKSSIVQIEGEELRQLVTEVRETLATDLQMKNSVQKQKRFTVTDLWNCHSKRRTAASLRRF